MNALDPFEENDIRGVLTLLAEDRPEPAVTDLVAAQQAWALAHRPALPLRVTRSVRDAVRTAAREHPRLVLPALAGLALVLVLGALAVLPAVNVSRPLPATTPSGPGALPDRLFVPPTSVPLVTDAPISRAAYLMTAGRPAADGNIPDQAGYVVGADGAEYRRLPEGAENGILSADGRLLAWALAKPEGDGEHPVRALARVRVLDLATGRTGDVTLPSVFNVDTSVDGLDLDAAGRRLVVWGSDSYDGVSALGAAFLVDLSAFVAGDGAPALLDRCLRCRGPFAWLTDGRLGVVTTAGAPAARLGGLGTVDLPPDPRTEGTSTVGLVGPELLVDARGTTTYWVTSAEPASAGPPDTFTLLARGSVGDPRETPLGRATEVRGLAVVPSGVLTVRWDAPLDAPSYIGEQRVDLVAPGGGQTLVTTGENGVFVQQVARDVAVGGKVVAGAPPLGSKASQSRLVAFARDGFVLLGSGAVVVGALALLGVSLSRAWWRPVARLAARTLRFCVRPRSLALLGSGTATVVGLGLLAAPAVVEPLWAAQQPRAEADAPALIPNALADQRVRPRRAFDTPGRPRTVRVGAAFVTTVAQRRGVYAFDPATAMLVRIDNLPGVPESYREAGPYQALALSPAGRWVVLWASAGPDRDVALVDLREARVAVRRTAAPGDGGWLAVDDTGTLRAVEAPVLRTTLDGILPLSARVLLPAEGASAVAPGVFEDATGQMGYGPLPDHWWTWLGTPQAAALGRILAVAGGLAWLGLGLAWLLARRAGRGSTRIRVPRRVGG